MTDVVVDSSALLAHLLGEVGGERVADVVTMAHVSAVNLAEVVQKLVDRGADDAGVQSALATYAWRIAPLEEIDAVRVGLLRRSTRHLGLSLGDRACLALAKRLGLPVMTADRAWAELDLGVEVVLIR